ncbi:MAG: bifunctional adenosylcobinamide kinase/adenosylcobinamide-phosphate guanylyltransferase [Acidimicrobiaceae bacterium]|nr:bifunctional adenosylcobinamide kinase/adenosylcobinamide-phosphate guanylyltransferase [Acidimicrobiaceae bacterium]
MVLTGGVRSGKSTAAVNAAASQGAPVTFVATAETGDDEMVERVARHRAERPSHWATVEAPHDLAAAVADVDPADTIVIDCLAVWVSNRMLSRQTASQTMDERSAAERSAAERSAAEPAATQQASAEQVSAVRAPAEQTNAEIVAEAAGLARSLAVRRGLAVIVTNEVGSGVVPPTPLGREFRDLLGSVNQAVVQAADSAYLVVAGRLLALEKALASES